MWHGKLDDFHLLFHAKSLLFTDADCGHRNSAKESIIEKFTKSSPVVVAGSLYFLEYVMHVNVQIMHIREVVSKNYSPRGNFIKVWNTRGWKLSVFWIFIKLPRVDNFTNDRSPNVHYLFFIKLFQKSEQLMPAHAIAP